MNKRVLRTNELLKQEIGGILLREVGFENALVTITRVECSSNLIEAKVFVAVIPDEKINEVFAILNYELYSIQQMINKRLRMRPIPKIRFVKEKAVKEAEAVEQILHDIQGK